MKNFRFWLLLLAVLLPINSIYAQDMPSVSQSDIKDDQAQLGEDGGNYGEHRAIYHDKKMQYRAICAQANQYKPQVELEIRALKQKLGSKANDPNTLLTTKDGKRLYALEQWLKQENAAQKWALTSLKKSKERLDDAKADKYLSQWNLTADQNMNEWSNNSIKYQDSMSQKAYSQAQSMGQNLGSGRAMYSGGGYGGNGYGLGYGYGGGFGY